MSVVGDADSTPIDGQEETAAHDVTNHNVDESSIGPWLRGLKDGEAEAIEQVWAEFFQKLVRAIKFRLKQLPRISRDGEDMAASVLFSLWNGCQEGRFDNVHNRNQLWWTLLRLSKQKCINQVRKDRALMRGGDVRVVSLHHPVNERELYELLLADADDPQYLTILEDQCQYCLSLLKDETQRKIALLTVEGNSITEIAEKLDISESSVRRKLKIIQNVWKRAADEDELQ